MSQQEWGQECQTVGDHRACHLLGLLRMGTLFTGGYPSRGKTETQKRSFLNQHVFSKPLLLAKWEGLFYVVLSLT